MRSWLSFRTGIRALDLKVTGANRELAQWLLDHPRYSAAVIAAWIGCGTTRIKDLRRWATAGFTNEAHPTMARSQRQDGRRAADATLETNEDSESDDDAESDDGEIEVATPEVLEDNILHTIDGVRPNLPPCLPRRSLTNGLPSRTNVCTRRKRTCGPQKPVISVTDRKTTLRYVRHWCFEPDVVHIQP
jgi:hypothetical protein